MFSFRFKYSLFTLALLGCVFLIPPFTQATLLSEDEDARFQVMDSKGKVKVYRDETESTTRLHQGQYVDDGDKIVTGPKSEVYLRLGGQGVVFLGPNTKLNITRLHWFDSKGLQV